MKKKSRFLEKLCALFGCDKVSPVIVKVDYTKRDNGEEYSAYTACISATFKNEKAYLNSKDTLARHIHKAANQIAYQIIKSNLFDSEININHAQDGSGYIDLSTRVKVVVMHPNNKYPWKKK